jgi:CheY-like chemotaxis protein
LAKIFAMTAKTKGIAIDVQLTSAIPESITTDPTRLRQILTNLIGNSLKFTERGGVTIVAQLIAADGFSGGDGKKSARKRGARLLAIDVKDTGMGISATSIKRIFEPFVQADTSVTRRFGGTGLGLTISRRLARALGGDLTVDSDPGKGSTFRLTIDPGALDDVRMIDTLTDAGSHHADVQIDDAAKPLLPPATVLVADDGEANRQLLSVILRREGMKVETVADGQQAVFAVAVRDFDLILLDMQMPVMDGYTAARTLRDRGVKIPIVALTANAMQGDAEECIAAGCSAFLPKPVDIDRLRECLAEQLSGREIRGQKSEGRSDNEQALSAQAPSVFAVASQQPSQPERAATPTAQRREPVISQLPMDDPEFRQIVADFIVRLQDEVVALEALRDRRDFAELARRAHWLKGSGGTLGFPQFTDPAKQLEQACKDAAAPAVDAAMAEIVELVAAIKMPDDLSAPAALTTTTGRI